MNWNEQDCEEQPVYSDETMGGVVKAWEKEKARADAAETENKQLRLELHFPLVGDASDRIKELESNLTAARRELAEAIAERDAECSACDEWSGKYHEAVRERDRLLAWAQFAVTWITRQRQHYDKHPASISHSPHQEGDMTTFLLNLHNSLFTAFPGDIGTALETAKAALKESDHAK